VSDVKNGDFATPPLPSLYVPHPQCAESDMVVMLRGEGSADALVAILQQVVRDIDRTVPVYQSHRMEDYLAASVAQAG
jgi:hypothetical protein